MLCYILNIHTHLRGEYIGEGWAGRRKSRKQRLRELGECLESVKHQYLSSLVIQRSSMSMHSQNPWAQLPVQVYCQCQAHKGELLVLSQSWGWNPKASCTLGMHFTTELRFQSKSDWFFFCMCCTHIHSLSLTAVPVGSFILMLQMRGLESQGDQWLAQKPEGSWRDRGWDGDGNSSLVDSCPFFLFHRRLRKPPTFSFPLLFMSLQQSFPSWHTCVLSDMEIL